MKIWAAANNFTSAYILACRAGTTSRYSTGETPPIKAEQAWAVISLGGYMSERQHINEDLNESSSASPGGSQKLEIPPSPNSKWAANLFRWYFAGRGDFKARQDSIVRLYFETPIFWDTNILRRQCFGRRQYFETPIFSWDANNFLRRQYFETSMFWKTPIFWEANNFMRRQYFWGPPCFMKARIIYNNLLDFVAANICVYFQYLCIWVCTNIFGAIVLTLGLRLML